MNPFRQKTPWALLLILVLPLLLLPTGCNKPAETTAGRNDELRALQQKYDALATESQRKVDEAAKRYNDLLLETSNKLSAADARYRALEADAQAKIAQANLRETQVRVVFRKTGGGASAVQLTNLSSQPAPVMIRVERPSSDKKYVREFTLDPGQMKEIGQMAGWAFATGDVLTVSQADRKPATFTAP